MEIDSAAPTAAATSKLDMALEDISKARPRQRRSNTRKNPRNAPNAASSSHGVAAASSASTTFAASSKILVSNLHFGVTEADLKELFGSVGPLKKASLAFDATGKSKGTAEIEFVRKNDSMLAIKKYKDVALDGRPMRMEVVAPPTLEMTMGSRLTNLKPSATASNGHQQGGQQRRGRGGRRQNRPKPKTAEDLDAEMSSYMGGDVAMAE